MRHGGEMLYDSKTVEKWGDLFAVSLKNGWKFDVAIGRISTGRNEYMQGQTEHTPFQHVHPQRHECVEVVCANGYCCVNDAEPKHS